MTLKVGAAVVALLNASTELVALVGDRIYPLVADDVKTPFVTYGRTGLTPGYTKDGSRKDSVYMQMYVVGEYGESINVAGAIISALKGKRGVFAGVNIDTIRLADSAEGYEQNSGYVQDLTFEILINK